MNEKILLHQGTGHGPLDGGCRHWAPIIPPAIADEASAAGEPGDRCADEAAMSAPDKPASKPENHAD